MPGARLPAELRDSDPGQAPAQAQRPRQPWRHAWHRPDPGTSGDHGWPARRARAPGFRPAASRGLRPAFLKAV